MRQIKEFLLANQVRMRIFNQMFVYVIHLVQGFLNLMPPFIRNFGFRLMLGRCGKNVFFDYNIYLKFPWLIEAGNDVAINRGVQFFPAYHGNHRIRLGNDVYLAPNVCFFASGHDINDLTRLVGDDIVIGDHVWIGANAIVLPGVRIGENSVIGAGSVVTKSIPSNSIAVGNPARVIRTKE
jgi:maltose O-acetyltransferase